jgi:hypothetical protein
MLIPLLVKRRIFRAVAPGLNVNVTGRNEALSFDANGKSYFWVNLDKQGGFISNVMNTIPGINATGGLHDTWWNPRNGNPGSMFGFGFNGATNWGTMLPAAAFTGAAQYPDVSRVYLDVERRTR